MSSFTYTSITSGTIIEDEIDFPFQEIEAQMQNPTAIVPITLPLIAKYRGSSSSDDYNTFTRAIYQDMVNLYQIQQQTVSDAALVNETAVEKYNALATQIQQLTNQIQNLQALYQNIVTLESLDSSANTIVLTQSLYNTTVLYGGFPSYFPASSPLPYNQRAVYEPKYGQIVGAYLSNPISKTYLIDNITGQIINPANIVSITEMVSTPSFNPQSIEENDPGQAVTGSEDTIYRRNAFYLPQNNIDHVDFTYTLNIPEQYVNDLLCNYVTIHPYPEFTQSINSVMLQGPPGTTSQQLLPKDNAGFPIPIPSAGKTRFLFPDFTTQSFHFKVRQKQSNLNLEPGVQAFITGASVIDIGYISFTQTSSRVLIPFTLKTNFFQSIVSVTPSVDGISFNLWYDTGGSDIAPIDLGATIPGMCQTVYVEVVITPSVGVMPVLESLSLEFVPLFGQN